MNFKLSWFFRLNMLISQYADELDEILSVYIKAVFGEDLVELVRSEHTLGLIKARLYGLSRAKGEVLVFMDSHMEVQHHW